MLYSYPLWDNIHKTQKQVVKEVHALSFLLQHDL